MFNVALKQQAGNSVSNGSVKPALTHFFPGISTPHHQHKHWDAVFNEAPHSILPRINIARIAQRGVFTQPGSFAEAAPACLSPYAGLAFPPPHTRISSPVSASPKVLVRGALPTLAAQNYHAVKNAFN
jgi:hypothetical protein